MPRTTCGKDGWEMLPYKIQVIKPECEIRVWLACPNCKNVVVDTYTYPVGGFGGFKDIEVQIVED
jgi:hypothetical protein